jgi:hypothetical protein
MSQPVKLSETMVLDARLTAELTERSIAGQIEYWANLGRAIEKVLEGAQVLALCRSAAAQPLSECLELVDTADGRQRLADTLKGQPFPHYEPAAERGLLVRVEANGQRTLGRFVKRQFQAVKQRTAGR